MPLDLRQAASRLIDAGYSDDEIKGAIGEMKNQASKMMDQGMSDAEITGRLALTRFKDKRGRDIILFQGVAPKATLQPSGMSFETQGQGPIPGLPAVPFLVDRPGPGAGPLEFMGLPGEMAGQAVQRIIEPRLGGTASDIAGAITQEATNFFLPGAIAKKGQQALKGIARILPGSQAAKVGIGIDELKGAVTALTPAVGSQAIRDVALSDPGIRVPMAPVYDTLQDILKSAKAMATPDSELVKVAENLSTKINRKGNTLTLADVQAELTDIGERVNNLASQGQAVNPQYSKIFGSIAKGLEAVPQGAQLRQAAQLYRREKGIGELNDIIDKVVMQKRGTGAQDINANRMLKELKQKEFLRESFQPGELKDVEDLLQKLIEMPTLPPPRGAAMGFGRAGTVALGIGGGGTLGGLDPTMAGAAGALMGSLMELSRTLLPSPIGRKALRAVLESGPIDQNKINMLAAVARGISGINLAPPQAQQGTISSQ